MSETQINYDELVQNALRGVVRDLLRQVVDGGLPGAHHFYIAFRTRAPGVDIPEHLKQRYPDDMTIVVQHRFWGLEVHEDYFAIGLSFNHKPERLVIPFGAVVGFVDPSVQFALQFQDNDDSATGSDNPVTDLQDHAGENRTGHTESDENAVTDPDTDPETGTDSKTGDATPHPGADGGDNVVTLDAFRKKT